MASTVVVHSSHMNTYPFLLCIITATQFWPTGAKDSGLPSPLTSSNLQGNTCPPMCGSLKKGAAAEHQSISLGWTLNHLQQSEPELSVTSECLIPCSYSQIKDCPIYIDKIPSLIVILLQFWITYDPTKLTVTTQPHTMAHQYPPRTSRFSWLPDYEKGRTE